MTLWDELFAAESRCRVLGSRPIRHDDEIVAYQDALRDRDRLRNAILRAAPWTPDPVKGPEMPRH